jgi:hypothetical protein
VEALTFGSYHYFDADRCRHYSNDVNITFHCHHYTALFTRVALEAQKRKVSDAPQLLMSAAEDSFRDVLRIAFDSHFASSYADKMALAQQYYAWVGLGDLDVLCVGVNGGEARLRTSHVDTAWLNKWGKSEQPINFLTCGFLAALLAEVYGKPSRFYRVKETESIVCGSSQSHFVMFPN